MAFMNWRKWLFLPPVALGIGLFVLQTRPSGEGLSAPPPASATPVRVVEVTPQPLSAHISGFGRVASVREWQAISQVDGRIIGLADGLAVGTVVAAGTPLIRIDTRDYEIAQDKAQANLASAEALLTEMDAEEQNAHASLALEREIESFLQTEYDRRQILADRGTVSQASLEQAHRELLNQRRQVLDLENRLALYPVQRVSIQSTIQTRMAELEEAERDLQNATIVAPFRGRVTVEDLSVGEYVRPGDWLLTLEDIAAAEIVAEVQPSAIRTITGALAPGRSISLPEPHDAGAALARLRQFDLQATVHQTIGDAEHVWSATLDRHTGIADRTTGTIGLAVRVEEPMRPDPSTRRPPLVTGSFVEIRITVTAPRGVLKVDRPAVWTGADGASFVYVVDSNSALQRRTVTPSAIIDDQVVIAEGLSPGDVVVLSDPQPAVLGMALTPIPVVAPNDLAASE